MTGLYSMGGHCQSTMTVYLDDNAPNVGVQIILHKLKPLDPDTIPFSLIVLSSRRLGYLSMFTAASTRRMESA